MQTDLFYISVDVETAGPNPANYALLSIGACTIEEPRRSFYVELQPDRDTMTPEAAAVHGLTLENLAVCGIPPREALARLEEWLRQTTPPEKRPLFVAFNAPFDWMFINDYFHRYMGHNPFGHAALDIKAYYMGLAGASWEQTSMRHIGSHYRSHEPLTHNALQDAIAQAELFRRMLDGYNEPPPSIVD